jgi:hypothetical protein
VTHLPPPVRAVCTTFLDAVPAGLVTGLYLHGGLAFGEWVEGHSDVDFTATLVREPTPDDIASLRSAHEAVAAAHGGGPRLEGVHLLADDLTRDPERCPDRPTISMRGFDPAGRFDLSPVSWHELARHGVSVAGPPVESLGVWTDDDVLRTYTVDNLGTYWRGQVEACVGDPVAAASEDACAWVVPGVARLDHLLVTGEQTAKSRAVRWGLGHYPERRHRVLREALRLREGTFPPQYDDPADRAADVTSFASYVVEVGTRAR